LLVVSFLKPGFFLRQSTERNSVVLAPVSAGFLADRRRSMGNPTASSNRLTCTCKNPALTGARTTLFRSVDCRRKNPGLRNETTSNRYVGVSHCHYLVVMASGIVWDTDASRPFRLLGGVFGGLAIGLLIAG